MLAFRRILHCCYGALFLGCVLVFLTKHSREVVAHAAHKIHEVGSSVIGHYASPSVTAEHILPSTTTAQASPDPTTTNDTPLKPQVTHLTAPTIPVGSSDEPSTLEPPTSLSVLCDKTAWTEGLWLQCHSGCGENKTSFCGGLTNARNRIQTCIRLAIDAGASVIIPSVTTRAEDDLLNTNQRSVCPNEWWNTNRLQSVMNRECPQLKMQFCEVDVPDSRILEPEYRNYLAEGHRNSTFEALMRETMNSSGIEPSSVSPKNQVVLKYGDTYIAWDYAKSDEMSSIRKDLFNALTYNATLLGFGQDILNSPQLEESAFIGVHLRGEGDWPSGFGSAYDQMSRYVEAIENITKTMPDAAAATVYVSCGDQNAIQTFREILEPLNYTVHDKWTLLADQPAKLARIETLGFDQKGIVEYEVLTHSRLSTQVVRAVD